MDRLTVSNPKPNSFEEEYNRFYRKDYDFYVRGFGTNGTDIELNSFLDQVARSFGFRNCQCPEAGATHTLDGVHYNTGSIGGLLELLRMTAVCSANLREKLFAYESSDLQPYQVHKLATNAPLEKMNNAWINADDCLPETFGKYLVYVTLPDGHKVISETIYDPEKRRGSDWLVDECDYVTHWMPLPKPPTHWNPLKRESEIC